MQEKHPGNCHLPKGKMAWFTSETIQRGNLIYIAVMSRLFNKLGRLYFIYMS
jgi:hypothetical protein